jgi:hypothetical protein
MCEVLPNSTILDLMRFQGKRTTANTLRLSLVAREASPPGSRSGSLVTRSIVTRQDSFGKFTQPGNTSELSENEADPGPGP